MMKDGMAPKKPHVFYIARDSGFGRGENDYKVGPSPLQQSDACPGMKVWVDAVQACSFFAHRSGISSTISRSRTGRGVDSEARLCAKWLHNIAETPDGKPFRMRAGAGPLKVRLKLIVEEIPE